MKIAILYGGKSGEHDVSRRSAVFIARNLYKKHSLLAIGISQEGRWYLQDERVIQKVLAGEEAMEIIPGDELAVLPGNGLFVNGKEGLRKLEVDIVFPVLHGTYGEDGTVQGLLECSGLPYTGSDVAGSAIAIDKALAKSLWDSASIKVTPCITVKSIEEMDAKGEEALSRFGLPLFVKPAGAGSSLGTRKIAKREELEPAIREALRWDIKALIEPFMDAREIECSVIGNESPRAFIPGEVIPAHEFYSYEAKYTDPDGASLEIPAILNSDVQKKVMETACLAYRVAGLSGYARIDFFLERKTGELYLNEANTIPGFTSISMFPLMCIHGGLNAEALLEEIISLAIERKKKKDRLEYSRL